MRKGNVKLPPPRTPKVDFPTKLSKPKAPVAPPKKSPLPEVTKFARASVPQTNRDLDRKGGRSSYNLGRGSTRKQGRLGAHGPGGKRGGCGFGSDVHARTAQFCARF